MSKTENKFKEVFYPWTPSHGKKLRKAKLTAAEWAIYTYFKNESGISKMKLKFQNCNNHIKNETEISEMKQNYQNCNNEEPEPLPSKDSSTPHTIHTNPDFKHTLSEEEERIFLNFVREKWREERGQEIYDMTKFLDSEEKILYWRNRFKEGVDACEVETDWKTHPDYNAMLIEIKQNRNLFVARGEYLNDYKERQEFVNWLMDNDLI